MRQPAEVVAAVGLGSNLDDPQRQVLTALKALAALPQSRLLASSRLYRSLPMGPANQPDYVNAAATIATRLAPLIFLDALQAIEAAQGRRRDGPHWGARTLDLDLLLWGRQRIDHPRLQVPHPGLQLRPFVLYPLAEIGADCLVPGCGSIRDLCRACAPDGLIGTCDDSPGAAG